jgi:hypothetical protein
MNKRYPAVLLAGIAGLALVMPAMSAAPASAASICDVEVLSIQSYELVDGDGQDEIKFELGDDEYGPFSFPNNWIRNDSLGHPHERTSGSSVHFELWETEYPFTTTLGTRSLSCTNGDHESVLEKNGGGYILKYRTTH